MSKEKKSKKKVNPWVKPRVKKAEEKSSPARYIIEVKPDTREQVMSQLEEITDVSIVKKSADRYIVLIAPSEAIAIIEDIPEVVKISADTLAWIKDMSLFSGEIDDPWIGTTKLSSIEIECGPLDVPGTLLMKILGDTEENIYTTDYTRRYLNIPEDNTITTRVAVLDTGLLWPHLLMKKMVFLNSFTGEPPLDGQGHGCLTGKTKVLTSFCGLMTLEELWNRVASGPISQNKGEFKPIKREINTPSKSGITRVLGVYRTRAEEKVVVQTKQATIESTTWHRFFVVIPRKAPSPIYHRRWYMGYDIEEREAKDLKSGDVLLLSTFRNSSWSIGIDTKLSYLGGLTRGDGTLINGKRKVRLRRGRDWKGEVYETTRSRYELRIHDQNIVFLERLASFIGKGSIQKEAKSKGRYLDIYGKKLVREVEQLLEPPFRDLDALRAWIAGFFDAEGNVDEKGIRICNTDRDLLESLSEAMNIVGIYNRIHSGGESKGSRTWHLRVYDRDLFYSFIKPYSLHPKIEKIIGKTRESYNHKIKRSPTDLMVQIDDVEVVSCDEWFYDLTTNEENYSADGLIVHNTWCSTTAFGDKASHPAYGPCSGIADPTEQMHGKVLSNAGFGMTSWILDGMYYAVKEYGAKVVSMSLGGPLQGSAIDDDPMCRLIASLKDEAIFVVAAGNSGPDEWSIGSPGAAPDALTVASWGIIRDDIASFSSRGPSGEYYKDNRDIWEQDKEAAGENIIKPDCACPGGDDGEKLLSGCAGWYDPVADLVPQFGTMRGTSMATPHAAGIIALAYDRGMIRTADDVRRRIKTSYKSIHSGYGLLSWDKLFG